MTRNYDHIFRELVNDVSGKVYLEWYQNKLKFSKGGYNDYLFL
jgi:hypothetical protein